MVSILERIDWFGVFCKALVLNVKWLKLFIFTPCCFCFGIEISIITYNSTNGTNSPPSSFSSTTSAKGKFYAGCTEVNHPRFSDSDFVEQCV